MTPCSKTMRSTPWPDDTFRTVNNHAEARAVLTPDHALEHLHAFLAFLARLDVSARGLT